MPEFKKAGRSLFRPVERSGVKLFAPVTAAGRKAARDLFQFFLAELRELLAQGFDFFPEGVQFFLGFHGAISFRMVISYSMSHATNGYVFSGNGEQAGVLSVRFEAPAVTLRPPGADDIPAAAAADCGHSFARLQGCAAPGTRAAPPVHRPFAAPSDFP